MQFVTMLSLLAATAIASPVAAPEDKNITISIPHITTTTVNIPQTTFTATVGSYVETFTVPALPTGFVKRAASGTGYSQPPLSTGHPGHHHHHNGSEPHGSHNGTEEAKSTYWRFRKHD